MEQAHGVSRGMGGSSPPLHHFVSVKNMHMRKKMNEKEIRAAACLLQHAWTFFHQSGKEADFGKPCENCPQNETCNFEWIDMWSTFNSRKEISELVSDDI